MNTLFPQFTCPISYLNTMFSCFLFLPVSYRKYTWQEELDAAVTKVIYSTFWKPRNIQLTEAQSTEAIYSLSKMGNVKLN